MKFICPNCGTAEEVIGDNAPRCLICRASLLKAETGYAGLWMSPSIAIRRFEAVIGKYGMDRATAGRLKQEREAWIAAVWSLGLRQLTGKEYWIELETSELTPDAKVHFIDQASGYNKIMTHNLEIVEWDEHRTNVAEVVEQKCQKAYPPYFSLVVLARNGQNIEIESLQEHIASLTIPFSEMWILGRRSGFSYASFMLHPITKLIEFDLAESLRAAAGQRDFMKRQKRGKSTEFQHLGLTYLPLP